MVYLLDTHLLLWTAYDPDRLKESTKALLRNSDHALLFSAASI